jgi:hypothetical protein
VEDIPGSSAAFSSLHQTSTQINDFNFVNIDSEIYKPEWLGKTQRYSEPVAGTGGTSCFILLGASIR